MRCISPYSGYSITVFEGNEQIVVDARGYAQTVVLEKPVIANFERSGLLDNEIEAALTSFTFAGLPEGINPLTRIAVFDTEAYCSASAGRPARRAADQDRPAPPRTRAGSPDGLHRRGSAGSPEAVGDVRRLHRRGSPRAAARHRVQPGERLPLRAGQRERSEVLEAMLRQYDPVKADAEYGEAEADHEEPAFLVES
jgi:hypothetical protein